ncbi:hypothetical protein ABQD66_11765, partial [Enterococcus hirae]|uniref:hypothetical protein n=1 Tax=Enterococcus TaxID=1350 RepID=UPI001F060BA3
MEIKSERRCKAFKNDRPASISTVFSKAAKACRSIILIFILLSEKSLGQNLSQALLVSLKTNKRRSRSNSSTISDDFLKYE